MHCLLQSYLMSRRQFVSYNGCNSSTQQIEYGVPQGSILGPYLADTETHTDISLF